MKSKNLDALFEIINKDLNQSKKGLNSMAIIVLIIVIVISIFIFSNYNDSIITPKFVLNYVLFIFFIATMFGIGFYTISKKKDFYKRKDFQWFINHPEDVINYKIIVGEISQIELIGKNNKSTFNFKSSELEAEKTLKKTFPQFQKLENNISTDGEKSENKIVDKRLFLENIPDVLKVYFLSIENYKSAYYKKKKFSIFITLIVILFFLTSTISFFTGYPDFYMFGYRNISFYILILITFILVLHRIDNYSTIKEWLIYFQKKQSEIIWIYTTETQNSIKGIPTGKTKTIYVCNSKGKKLHIIPIEDYETVYIWLTSYFDNAIIGFSYEYETLFKNQPKSFVQQIKNRKN